MLSRNRLGLPEWQAVQMKGIAMNTTPRPWYQRWYTVVPASALTIAAVAGTASAVTSHQTTIVQRPAAATSPATPVKPAPSKTAAPTPTSPTTPAQAPAPVAPAAPVINIYNSPPGSGYVVVPQYSPPSYVADNEAIVQQYYDYLNNHDYQDAWNMGGNALNNYTGYDSWVAGYDTTSWISLSTFEYYPGSNAIQVTITAGQTDGSVNTYQGSYTVSNGVITGANIIQTS